MIILINWSVNLFLNYVIRFSKYVNVISFGTIEYIQVYGANMINLMSNSRRCNHTEKV